MRTKAGGFYITGGSVSLTDSVVSGNLAVSIEVEIMVIIFVDVNLSLLWTNMMFMFCMCLYCLRNYVPDGKIWFDRHCVGCK